MTRSNEPTLPRDRAFVVQLRGDAALDDGAVRGRVEHLVTGETARFETGDQLCRCLMRLLAAADGSGSTNPKEEEPTQ